MCLCSNAFGWFFVCVPVALCIDPYSVTLPESVEAVRGLCVFIPCTFTIDRRFDKELQGDPKGIWRKDGTEQGQTVFDSTTPENKINGKITGCLILLQVHFFLFLIQ